LDPASRGSPSTIGAASWPVAAIGGTVILLRVRRRHRRGSSPRQTTPETRPHVLPGPLQAVRQDHLVRLRRTYRQRQGKRARRPVVPRPRQPGRQVLATTHLQPLTTA